MTCLELRDLAPLYWSCELDSDRRLALERHLETCGECAEEMKLQRWNDEQLRRAVLQAPVDASLVVRNVQRELAGSAVHIERRTFGRFWLALPALAALALAILFFVMRRQSAPALLYSDAADDHYDEVVQRLPRQWISGTLSMAPILREYGVDPALADRLAPAGYRIEKIRICELADHDYVHMVFSNGPHEISIFVRRAIGERIPGPIERTVGNTAVHEGSSGHYQVAAFHAARYEVVVTTDESRLTALDEACKAAQQLASLSAASATPDLAN
jgi:hypothetical protein